MTKPTGIKQTQIIGKCDRYLQHQDKPCGKKASFIIYDGCHQLCKACYQRFKAGKQTLFQMPPKPTVQQLWELQQRLSAEDLCK